MITFALGAKLPIMTDELYINGNDAYSTWGIGFEDGAIATLMTPATLKEFITNSSRLEHGTRYIPKYPKYDKREITVQFHLIASSQSDYLAKYNAFVDDVLATGKMVIYDKKYTGNYYRCIYNSCSNFQHNINGLAKFQLKLTEPDPTDRASTSTHTEIWS